MNTDTYFKQRNNKILLTDCIAPTSLSKDSNTPSNSSEFSSLDSLSLITNDLEIITKFIPRKYIPELTTSEMTNDEELPPGSNIYSDDELIWHNPIQPRSEIYKPDHLPPYIVLMESIVKTLNVGKLNPIAMADLIQNVITGKRLIQRSGINRVKITCDSREDANLLIQSDLLASENFKLYIPNSIKFSKCVIKEIDCSLSVKDFVGRIEPEELANISTVRRRVTYDKRMLEALELTYHGNTTPSKIIVSSYEFLLTPVSMKPIRCFYCQRYRHTETQCRSRYYRCVYCCESHEQDRCPLGLRRAVCCNCSGDHPAFSTTCPIYQKEAKIQKIRTQYGVGYQEAEEILQRQTPEESQSEADVTIVEDSVFHTEERIPTTRLQSKDSKTIQTMTSGSSEGEDNRMDTSLLEHKDGYTSTPTLIPQLQKTEAISFITPSNANQDTYLNKTNKKVYLHNQIEGYSNHEKQSHTISPPSKPLNERKKFRGKSPSI